MVLKSSAEIQTCSRHGGHRVSFSSDSELIKATFIDAIMNEHLQKSNFSKKTQTKKKQSCVLTLAVLEPLVGV